MGIASTETLTVRSCRRPAISMRNARKLLGASRLESEIRASPVGALPSLHAAWPFMIMLFFWLRAGRWRILLVGYTLAMAYTLVYTGDHFVFDILLGWTYVIVAVLAVRFFTNRRRLGRKRDHR